MSVEVPSDYDWSTISAAVDGSGVGPLIVTRLDELGLTAHVPEQQVLHWKADRLHAELQCDLQRSDAVRTSRALHEREIRHAFIKGFALREWLYAPTWVRAGADIDILVSPEDREAARHALLELGFAQAARTDDFRLFRPATPAEIASTEAEHYELAQFARILRLLNGPEWLFCDDFRRQAPSAFEMTEDGPILNLVIDIHWALHFMFADERPLDTIQMIRSSEDGSEIPVLSNEWNVLFTAFKLYFEAFERPGWGLHMLVDLAALLTAARADLDWEWLSMQATRRGLEAMLFYTITAAERLLDRDVVPPGVSDRLARRDARSHSVQDDPSLDFGDFVPHMLGRRFPSAFLETNRSREDGQRGFGRPCC